MTKKHCIKNHRIMWNWLADNPDKNKKDWPGWVGKGWVRCFCFLCEYIISHNLPCDRCPLDWGETTDHCHSYGSPYKKYKNADDLSEKSYYARKIANLKEREERFPGSFFSKKILEKGE